MKKLNLKFILLIQIFKINNLIFDDINNQKMNLLK